MLFQLFAIIKKKKNVWKYYEYSSFSFQGGSTGVWPSAKW